MSEIIEQAKTHLRSLPSFVAERRTPTLLKAVVEELERIEAEINKVREKQREADIAKISAVIVDGDLFGCSADYFDGYADGINRAIGILKGE